jgi:hypothetical protein
VKLTHYRFLKEARRDTGKKSHHSWKSPACSWSDAFSRFRELCSAIAVEDVGGLIKRQMKLSHAFAMALATAFVIIWCVQIWSAGRWNTALQGEGHGSYFEKRETNENVEAFAHEAFHEAPAPVDHPTAVSGNHGILRAAALDLMGANTYTGITNINGVVFVVKNGP